jgi:uncharacterized OB-fold protein
MTARRPGPALPTELARLHPDATTAPFWTAAREHRLCCQRCATCGTPRMPPAPICWHCHSTDVAWVELPGTGTVYTYVITFHPPTTALAASVPYAVAVIDLDGAPGARLVAALTDPDEVHIGQRVTLAWDDIDDQVSIPRFTALQP